MKIFYHNAAKPGVLESRDGVISLLCSQPTVIQPGEIKKVQTGLTLKITEGYAFTLYTAPLLWQKAAEIFPAVLVLDHSAPETPLEIPVRNSGRSQLNLLTGQTLALGILVKVENVELEEFTPSPTTDPADKVSRPQKRNTDVRFEIK